MSLVKSTDPLHTTLADLRRQLAEASPLDPEERASLARALHTIADKLTAHESGLAVPAGEDDAGEQLRAAARRFEADHPALATTLESLVDALTRMGI